MNFIDLFSMVQREQNGFLAAMFYAASKVALCYWLLSHTLPCEKELEELRDILKHLSQLENNARLDGLLP